jgi:hypothetical protein
MVFSLGQPIPRLYWIPCQFRKENSTLCYIAHVGSFVHCCIKHWKLAAFIFKIPSVLFWELHDYSSNENLDKLIFQKLQ